MKQLNWYQIFGNVHIIPDGKTVTPTDDIQTLLHCANIWDKSYTTLAEVLADDDTLFLICISNNAIDYLVRSTTWAIMALVPTMTSATTPSGEVVASSQYSAAAVGWHAFDGSNSTYAGSILNGAVGYYIAYHFTSPVCVDHFFMQNYTGYAPATFKIQGSNDGVTWADISDTLTNSTNTNYDTSTYKFANTTEYSWVRMYVLTSYGGSGLTIQNQYANVLNIQFYSASITSSESAMQYIGASDYASETLLSDSTWLTAIDGSAYKDYVANVSVPKMTSNTTPSGECIGTNLNSTNYYYGFDENDSTKLYSFQNDLYLGYVFPYAVRVFEFAYKANTDNPYLPPKTIKMQVSEDGVAWVDATDAVNTTNDANWHKEAVSNALMYRYHRVTGPINSSSYQYAQLSRLQFYGREIGGVQSWLKAGGITNKKYTTVSEVLSDLTTLATLMSSTDAIDYLVTAKGWATEICSDSNAMADIGMNNYAANTLLADETWAEAIGNSTYWTSVLNASVPAMTDNTHPYGECFASNAVSYAWMAFNGTNTGTSDMWSSDNAVPQSIGYKFSSPVRIAKVMIANRKGASPGYIHSVRDFALEGSNDGVAYTKIKDFLNTVNTQGAETYYSNAIGTTYTYYRINISSTNESNTPYIGRLQFYGRKDI